MTLKFWVFTGIDYYALGGVCGLSGRFELLAEAVARVRKLGKREEAPEWYHIVDVEAGSVVRHYGGGGCGSDAEARCPYVTLAPEDSGKDILIPQFP